MLVNFISFFSKSKLILELAQLTGGTGDLHQIEGLRNTDRTGTKERLLKPLLNDQTFLCNIALEEHVLPI